MCIHAGKRPFCCEVCDTTFTLKAALAYHMRIHTAEHSFSGEVCYMEDHMAMSHAISRDQSYSGTSF